uniref:Uncharacterized protein n=1 Tax=Pongo abelii TaxID=9601 RepID=A0A8I5TK07_PONAB
MLSPSLPEASRAGRLLRVRGHSSPRPPGTRAGCHPRLFLHTSPQGEEAGSGLGQARNGLPQCSGGLKGSLSAARVGAKAKEARRASESCQQAVTSHKEERTAL